VNAYEYVFLAPGFSVLCWDLIPAFMELLGLRLTRESLICVKPQSEVSGCYNVSTCDGISELGEPAVNEL